MSNFTSVAFDPAFESTNIGFVDSCKYSAVVQKLRSFFFKRNFVEVHPQSRLSILAACEDIKNIATFNYSAEIWPLPQTGQMWLEYELLNHPQWSGCFCVSTSYRAENNPIPGRHNKIFPMFEFECHGTMEDLIRLEKDLLIHLGYCGRFIEIDYDKACADYGVKELEHEHEERLCDDHPNSCIFLKNFPNLTGPFWNMKQSEDKKYARKVDVILSGQETIGSAQREDIPAVMRDNFNNLLNGKYAKTLYDLFTEKRVQKELNDYLDKHKFFPRIGAGIGLTRLIRSMTLSGIL